MAVGEGEEVVAVEDLEVDEEVEEEEVSCPNEKF